MARSLLIFASMRFGFFFLLFAGQLSFSQTMHIGLLNQNRLQRIMVSPSKGKYLIKLGDSIVDTLRANEELLIATSSSKLQVSKSTRLLGEFTTLSLTGIESQSALRVKPTSPSLKERVYKGGLSISTQSSRLLLVNDVQLADYLAGVIQSEGGKGQALEYYKVQAVISRTYALKNKDKHQAEGFQLCDGVHCQAYFHCGTSTDIQKGVTTTKGLVLTDSSGRLIDVFFHANCGGQTSKAEYVWNTPLSYAQPFIDTFCIHTAQAKWVKRIPQSTWQAYLVKQFAYPLYDSLLAASIFDFEQTQRVAFYKSPNFGIPLRDLRKQFGLKSTFFSCHPEGNEVVLEGRGYGHGVGLCQEGAMNMAEHQYSFQQILAFYFYGTQIVPMKNLNYFSQTSPKPFEF